jgi:hypothetical protein
MTDREKLEGIWKQKVIPVIFRKEDAPLMFKVPFVKDDYEWIRNERRNKPTWLKKYSCWEIPKKWFNDSVNRSLQRWGKIYIIQPFHQQEKCAPACAQAIGHICECSCMGENHGSGGLGAEWYEVSDAFATKWHQAELACRLLVASQKNGKI